MLCFIILYYIIYIIYIILYYIIYIIYIIYNILYYIIIYIYMIIYYIYIIIYYIYYYTLYIYILFVPPLGSRLNLELEPLQVQQNVTQMIETSGRQATILADQVKFLVCIGGFTWL